MRCAPCWGQVAEKWHDLDLLAIVLPLHSSTGSLEGTPFSACVASIHTIGAARFLANEAAYNLGCLDGINLHWPDELTVRGGIERRRTKRLGCKPIVVAMQNVEPTLRVSRFIAAVKRRFRYASLAPNLLLHCC